MIRFARQVYAILKTEDAQRLAAATSATTSGANASNKVLSDDTGEKVLGVIAGTQSMVDASLAVNMTKEVSKRTAASGYLGVGYVAVTIILAETDGSNLTAAGNTVELGDVAAAVGGALALMGFAPVAVVAAVAGGAYYVYQSNSRTEKVTWDRFIHGYDKTAMDGCCAGRVAALWAGRG